MDDARSAAAPGAGMPADSGTADAPATAGWQVTDWLVGLLVLLNGLYFYNGADWNQFARYDVILGYVEPGTVSTGTFAINALVPDALGGVNTGDWARNPALEQPLVYSNKAPGPMLLGIPIYYVMYHAETALGWDPLLESTTVLNCYILNLFLTVLPLAAAFMVFHRMLRRLARGAPRWALLATLGLALGSLLWPYATSLWSYPAAAACVIFMLAAYQRGGSRNLVACGLWGGMAVLCEYTCGMLVAFVGLALLWSDGRGRRGMAAAERGAAGALRRLGAYGLGGLPLAGVYAVYHDATFGLWWAPASIFSNPVFLDQDHVGGLFSGIHTEAIWGLSFSPYRGLFYSMPWLVTGLLALPLLLLRGRTRRWGLICGLGVLGFFALNLTFNGWHGGLCIGPRYQIPVLPLWALLIYRAGVTTMAWLRRGGRVRVVAPLGALMAVLMLVSVWHMSLATIVTPMMSQQVTQPYRLLRHAFFDRMWHRPANRLRADQPWTAAEQALLREGTRAALETLAAGQSFNLGEKAGLAYFASLLPWLLGVLLLGGLAWRRAGPASRRGAAGDRQPAMPSPSGSR